MAQNSAKTGDILMIKKRRKSLIHKDFQRFLLPLLKTVSWLGWQDLNLRMQQSKCCVLPLDDTPIFTFLKLYLNKRKSAREISCRFRKWGG
jgi:hypothetical protein